MNQPDSRRWVAHGVPVGAAPAPTPSRLRRRLGPLGLVGGLLLLAGLGLGGYVLWQMHGTNIVSERAHRELVLEAEAHWDRQTAIDRTSEQGRGSFTSRYGPVEAVIRIPRFGDDYAVPVLAGTSEHVLSVGYGHFAGTAEAGAVGNYALAAHRVTHGEPLRRMPELEVGDEMVVETGGSTPTGWTRPATRSRCPSHRAGWWVRCRTTRALGASNRHRSPGSA